MKANRNLITNKKGQANIIILGIFTIIMGFALLTIGNYIYYNIVTNVDAGTVIVHKGATATGSFAFNGSNFSSDASLAAPTLTSVTITNGAALYTLEFNTTTLGSPKCQTANCILIANTNTNNSLGGATNLTAQINANTSLAALVSASTSGNTTTVTYLSRGTAGNTPVLATVITPVGDASWIASSGMAGGTADLSGQATQNTINNYQSTVFPLFGLALMILGFYVIFVTLRKSFGSGEVR